MYVKPPRASDDERLRPRSAASSKSSSSPKLYGVRSGFFGSPRGRASADREIRAREGSTDGPRRRFHAPRRSRHRASNRDRPASPRRSRRPTVGDNGSQRRSPSGREALRGPLRAPGRMPERRPPDSAGSRDAAREARSSLTFREASISPHSPPKLVASEKELAPAITSPRLVRSRPSGFDEFPIGGRSVLHRGRTERWSIRSPAMRVAARFQRSRGSCSKANPKPSGQGQLGPD